MIVLIGVPTAGKTTLGRMLAERLSVPFYDLDDLVAKRGSVFDSRIDSTRKIVELHGEPFFRSLEELELRDKRFEKGVIALGGGTLLGKFDLKEIITDGFIVHLSIPFEVFMERILKRGLLVTCNTERGLYRGLLEFYTVRFEACQSSCHCEVDVSSLTYDLSNLRLEKFFCDLQKRRSEMSEGMNG